MKLTNQTKLIYFMRSGHIYGISDLEKSGIKNIRKIIENAHYNGFLKRVGRGRYKLTGHGLALNRAHVEPLCHTVIRAHVFDVPPLAWPV